MLRTNRLGETNINKQGDKMEIIEYITSHNCTIRFKTNDFIKFNVKYSDFKNGSVKNPYYPSIFKFGYVGGIKNPTRHELYNTWFNLIKRTKDDKYYESKPTYEKCDICDRWLNFTNFVEDYTKLLGYSKNKRRFLDKDIISDAGYYSLETCCLVNSHTNTFFAMISRNNSLHKTGVWFDGESYISQIRYKEVHLIKRFKDIDSASIFYWSNKMLFLRDIINQEKEELSSLLKNKFERLMVQDGVSIESLKEIHRVVGKTLDKKSKE